MTIKLPPIILDPITKKFTQLNNPGPERPHKVELTEEEKKRVVKDFKELMGRPPDEAEKESLFIEERKLKREKIKRGLTETVFINPERD